MVGAMLGFGYGMSTALSLTIHRLHLPQPHSSETPMVPANFSDLAEKVRPGVVNIQVVKNVKNVDFPWEPLWRTESLRRLLRTLFEGNPPSGKINSRVSAPVLSSVRTDISYQ